MKRTLVFEEYPWETRAAILENGRLVEVNYEDPEDRVGNIYKGVVRDVLPGLSCAFLDLGFDKNAFLYLGDVGPPIIRRAGELKRGQELMVQVKKEETPGKGARITTIITIPGHLLVLLPQQKGVSVSRRVKDGELRSELRDYLKTLKPDGVGLIVRTAGAVASPEQLEEELDSLLALWDGILQKSQKTPSPALLYDNLDIVQKNLRDYIDGLTTDIVVNSEGLRQEVQEFLAGDSAARGVKVKMEKAPFSVLGLEKEIARLLDSRVWLKSGGYLIIDETEAMTVIDVNSGKYVGRKGFEETIFKINQEAAREIPRQVRMRGLGGIILVDFIDMKDTNHHQEVLNILNAEMEKDKARSRVLGLTRLGLVEMTRKKVRGSMRTVLGQECPVCGGQGRVACPEAKTRELLRVLVNLSHRRQGRVIVEVLPALLPCLEQEQESVSFVETRLGKEVEFRENPDLPEPYKILS